MTMEEELSPSTMPSKPEKLKPPSTNVEDVPTKAPVLIEGFALQPVEDYDLLVGTFELDLTNNLEQAILDITGALASGYTLKLYAAENRDRYALDMETETIHFNQ